MEKEEVKKVDKKVYNYRTALEQPIWIQRLSKELTLPNAVKMSTIVWTLTIYLFYIYFVLRFLRIFSIPSIFWFSLGLFPCWSLGILLADLKVEQQPVLRFVRDYLKMYFSYGLKRHKMFLNDGQLFYRPFYILKKERSKHGLRLRK
ncbi:TcpE family conjugal transfer membrane protein [Streptococcus ferus]|uniref:TcpE family conjugal transfer membrane protein n=1 Tax=Streptococcus ferus TaxID=1345 RepID=UPI003510DCA4